MWKILSIEAQDELITQARYFASIEDGDHQVETEGNWYFAEPQMNVPFDQVTEAMIVGWIDKTGIEARLAEQMAALKAHQVAVLPWLPQTFSIGDINGS